jgi:hypothetical protein
MYDQIGRLLYGYRGVTDANQYSHAILYAIGHTIQLANAGRHRYAHRATNDYSNGNS